ncbi:MAG: hypothetical protein QG643_986 [Pseudomonadota bacterium]|nr:hypothetical protein [Pseudomonadota bacterium]
MVAYATYWPASLAPGLRRLGLIDASQPTLARNILAAATMWVSAVSTSFHWRVLSPQSGLTHSRSAGMRSAAFYISRTMCSCVGMLGEWMSYTPGPISFGYLKWSKASSSSMSERLVSMVITSASMLAMASMMSLNSE